MQNHPRQRGQGEENRSFSREPEASAGIQARLRLAAKQNTQNQKKGANQNHWTNPQVDRVTQSGEEARFGVSPPLCTFLWHCLADARHSKGKQRRDRQQENVIVDLASVGQGDRSERETGSQ